MAADGERTPHGRRRTGRASGSRQTEGSGRTGAHLAAVVADAPMVLFSIDRSGIFTLSEGKALAQLGLRPGQVVGQSVFEVYRDAPQVIENVRRALAGESFTSTAEVGELVFETSYVPVHDERGDVSGIIGVATDITARTRAVEELTEQARRDPLTGALNHGAITALLDAELHREDGAPVAVAMVDVNGMKAVNDTYGHLAGDAVLQTVARALARDGAVVGRYGGDEFLVVLPGADRTRAEAYAADVATAIREAKVTHAETSATIRLPVSIGVAMYPEEATTLVDLIKASDSAMYAAKAKRALEDGAGARRLDDRVSSMIADLVPLLTSPGRLDEKLRLVAGRLSTGTGYDAVDCQIFPSRDEVAQSTLREGGTDALTERWNQEQREHPARDRAITQILERTHRPIILEDLARDERLTEVERSLLASAGLQSAIVAPMIWDGQLIGVLSVARKAKGAFEARDAQFLAAVASQVTAIVRMATLVDGLQRATERLSDAHAETVMMLAAAAEAHDRTTGRHLESIRSLTETIAEELGYAPDAVRDLGLAATLHDIGKISVPDTILASPIRFDSDDWEIARVWDVMKRHSVWGAEFLQARQGFELAARVARWHHERWDGHGYPDGLAGKQIPEEVTIVTVADAFDAMVHDRPYRAARPVEEAIAELVRCRGQQFNPPVVDAMVRAYRRGRIPRDADSTHRRAA